MGLNYRNLDARTRALMVAEVERDIASNTLFLSDNLSPQGQLDYSNLLKAAAQTGSDVTLAAEIRPRLNSHEKPRKLRSGGFSKPPVMRSNAHEMLAEGEFNRFYIRALCALAIEDGLNGVVVYRAKAVENPRTESEQKIGQTVRPEALLQDLRTHPGVDTALGLPPGPNSGLSIQLP
ncbi:MAG: hypothetical protein AB7Q29_02180 [Vicinamibacterales bacterium]